MVGQLVRLVTSLINYIYCKKETDDELIRRLCVLAISLGKFPSDADLIMKRTGDKDFPSGQIFRRRLGRKAILKRRVAKYIKNHPEFREVLQLIGSIETEDEIIPIATIGTVYLLRSGLRFKIGSTRRPEERIGELASQSPHPVELIHKIETDDPSGIEAYWLNRFKDKRKHGEWFELKASDVASFKRRKKFM